MDLGIKHTVKLSTAGTSEPLDTQVDVETVISLGGFDALKAGLWHLGGCHVARGLLVLFATRGKW